MPVGVQMQRSWPPRSAVTTPCAQWPLACRSARRQPPRLRRGGRHHGMGGRQWHRYLTGTSLPPAADPRPTSSHM